MLTENAVNHNKIIATEIIDDILKGAVKLYIGKPREICNLTSVDK
jgi:hypothetical protein